MDPDNENRSLRQVLKSQFPSRTENPPQSLLLAHHSLQSVKSELAELNLWRRSGSEHLLPEWDVNEISAIKCTSYMDLNVDRAVVVMENELFKKKVRFFTY